MMRVQDLAVQEYSSLCVWDGYSMFYSKICSYLHHYALIAEVVGKRGRVNDLAVQKYKR